MLSMIKASIKSHHTNIRLKVAANPTRFLRRVLKLILMVLKQQKYLENQK